jgi:DNA replication and repair protein RecF
MRLTRLELEEFRCYRKLDLKVPSPGLRLHGLNASGKTSLLEAMYLLATLRSPRATQERELVNWASADEFGLPPYARVDGWISAGQEEHHVEVVLAADERRTGAIKKRIKLDGRARRAVDTIGTLKVVLFAPEDLNLVLGSPSVRRRYLDISISQIDPVYVRSLARYARILEQRNGLLKDLGARYRPSDPAAAEQLAYWDGELIARGAYVATARLRYLHSLGIRAGESFTQLTGLGRALTLHYLGTISLPDPQIERATAASSSDAQALMARSFEMDLQRLRDDELRRGVTLTGPHRDDFTFRLGGIELSAYGSRGQQRLAVIATKLAELRQVLTLAGDHPLLLLDDVLSELDAEHRTRLLDALAEAECQVFISSTDRDLLDQPSLSGLPFFEAVDGSP